MKMRIQQPGLLRTPRTNYGWANAAADIGAALIEKGVKDKENQDIANIYSDVAGLNGQFDQLGAPQTNTVDSNAPALVKNFDQGSFGTANFSPGLLKGAATAYGGDVPSAGDVPNTDGSTAGAGGLLSSPQYSFDQSLQKQQQPQRTMDSVADYAKNVQTTTTPGASPMDRTKMIRGQIPQVLAAMAKKYPDQMGTIGPMVLQIANQKIDDLNQQYTQQQLSSSMDGFNQAVSKGDRAAMVQHAVSLGRLGVKGIPELLKFASPEKNYGFMFAPDGTMMVTDKSTGNVRMEGSPGQYAKGPTTIYHVGGGGGRSGGGGGRGGGVSTNKKLESYRNSQQYAQDLASLEEYNQRVASGEKSADPITGIGITQSQQKGYNAAAFRVNSLNSYTDSFNNQGGGEDQDAEPQGSPPQENQNNEDGAAWYDQRFSELIEKGYSPEQAYERMTEIINGG